MTSAKQSDLLKNYGYNCTFCSVSLQEDSPRYSVVRNAGGDLSTVETCVTIDAKLNHSFLYFWYLMDW